MGLLIVGFVIVITFSYTGTVYATTAYDNATIGPVWELPPPTKTKNTSVTIADTAEANNTIKVYIGTDGCASWTHPIDNWATTTADASGRWSVSVPLTQGLATAISATQTDALGDESSGHFYYYMISDVSAPTVTIDPVAASTDEASVTVSGTVTKDSWEAWTDLTATVQVGSATAGALTIGSDGKFSTSPALSEGVNTITISATDAVGNPGTASVSIERTVALPVWVTLLAGGGAFVLVALAYFIPRRRK